MAPTHGRRGTEMSCRYLNFKPGLRRYLRRTQARLMRVDAIAVKT
ncbi:hypothetical protein QM806_40795 [Rhodococcus sp. IEGM 1351]|nr:hypothetical protein [Rhodococcus sp. IEGM 1351]